MSRHTIRMTVPAMKATPSPPVGPVLGQKGIKAIDFCKQFNEKSNRFVLNTPVEVRMKINPDKTYEFVVNTPRTSYLLKKAAGIEKGTSKPGSEFLGKISVKHIYEIAKMKQLDENLKERGLETICKMIIGQARGVGIEVVY